MEIEGRLSKHIIVVGVGDTVHVFGHPWALGLEAKYQLGRGNKVYVRTVDEGLPGTAGPGEPPIGFKIVDTSPVELDGNGNPII